MSAVAEQVEADIRPTKKPHFNVGLALKGATHEQRLSAFNAILATMNPNGRGHAPMALLIAASGRWRNMPYTVVEAFRENGVPNTVITRACEEHLTA